MRALRSLLVVFGFFCMAHRGCRFRNRTPSPGLSLTATSLHEAKQVSICLNASRLTSTVSRAQAGASSIFENVGVHLKWRTDSRQCAPPEDGIVINTSGIPPKTDSGDALAY